MTPKKRFFLKLGSLVGFLFLSQALIYKLSGGVTTLPQIFQQVKAIVQASDDVIIFGDSVMGWGANLYYWKPSIAGRLKLALAPYSVGDLSHEAYRSDMFLALYRYMARHHYSPKLVIIPVNLRGFSVEWDKKPEYQFVIEKLYLRWDFEWFRILFKPLAIWNAFDLSPISRAQYEALSVDFKGKLLGTLRNIYWSPNNQAELHLNWRNMFIARYMFDLSPQHTQLIALNDLATTALRNGSQVLIYLTPIDVEGGQQYVDSSFRTIVQQNGQTVKAALLKSGIHVLDLSTALPHSAFDWNSPNEHLTPVGRDFVAKAVCEELSKKAFPTKPIRYGAS